MESIFLFYVFPLGGDRFFMVRQNVGGDVVHLLFDPLRFYDFYLVGLLQNLLEELVLGPYYHLEGG